ncbi:tRNA-dihydrouridine synthase [Blastocystis sp. ATCC 50177/Nand II]|uniref:tRNA-dihydrouridine synthase n=1 Tax=Blastocystis sp. subtype 1 (strain ATCC 50177 / NandII) TaxID=478820 RepID=A0A196SGN1_BLAHN|nr:tRNA-dihydrouridine synthase [Blastocystis sp. ATCC 50177/Nand II]
MLRPFLRRMSSFPRDRISIAPMLGITNDYQRYFVRLMTKRATLYTEMFVDETVLHHPACDRLVHFDKSEHPIIAQLGGSNKYKLLEAARILEKAGYDEINLNCGCPSPQGLSVKENRSVPPLRYDWVFRLLDDFPALDFSLNGGVVNLGVAQELLDRRSAGGRQLRGVMIGRMLSKAPWLLHYVDQFFYGERNPPCDRYEAIMKYIDFCEEMQRGEFAPAFSPNEYLKPLFNVFVNTPGGGAYRREIFLGVNNGKSLREAVEHGLKFVSSDLLHDKAEGDIARIYEYEVPKD